MASWISGILRSVVSLLFPPECPVCGGRMTDGESVMCTHCRLDMPFTYSWQRVDNIVAKKLWGRLPFDNASAFIYFRKGSGYQAMIHRFKYRGDKKLAYNLGLWYGSVISEKSIYGHIDAIIPVPLHQSRMRKRGYNQAEYIARGMAESMGCEVITKAVNRVVRTDIQAQKGLLERNINVENAFNVIIPKLLEGKYVIVVDDVITTGATIESMVAAITKSVPDCRINIAAIAVVE